ncbi:MAG: hypothetical protein RL026_2291 [Pseudomonadota bacterium]|jgi:AAHS family 3-hydroxyphenylpropionic acid transporter
MTALPRTVVLCFLVALLEGFDIQALGIVAPLLIPDMQIAPGEAGWMFAIGNIGLVLGALAGGRMADHFGRKRILIAAVLGFAGGTFFMAHAGNYSALLLGRFIAGAGFGAAVPNKMALAAEASPPGRGAATIAAIMCGLPVGGAAAALLWQLLPADTTWRVLFIIGGLLPLPVAGALALWLQDSFPRRAGQSALPVLATLFGDGRALRTVLTWTAVLPVFVVMYLILNWLPLLVNAKGLEPRVAPQAALAFNIGSTVGGLLIGLWVDRHGRRWPLVACSLALITAFVVLAQPLPLAGLLMASLAVGFFVMGINFALYDIAASQYPTAGRGTGSGAAAAVGRLGSVMGPLLAGSLLAAGYAADDVLLLMVPVVGVAGGALFLLSLLRPPSPA